MQDKHEESNQKKKNIKLGTLTFGEVQVGEEQDLKRKFSTRQIKLIHQLDVIKQKGIRKF